MRHLISAAGLALVISACVPKDGTRSLYLITTNDLHGQYFDSTYVDSGIKPSMMSVEWYVDSIRQSVGEDNVLLVDAGDFLQGDNAAYYFNYVANDKEHLFVRLADEMGYDVIVGGNHDIETGHVVYDRLSAQFKDHGIRFLAGNAICNDSGERYFPYYALLKKAGMDVAVLGYDNAAISTWLDESLWCGMHFESLLPLVQKDVETVIEKYHPDIVIVIAHTGTGKGDGSNLESQGLDLYNSLRGVDALVCGHDHNAYVISDSDRCLLNSGSHARNITRARIDVGFKSGKIKSKSVDACLIPVRADKSSSPLKDRFRSDYEDVKRFTMTKIGELVGDMDLSDALYGMSPYINLIHTVCLSNTDADLSIAAPLTQKGIIKGGEILYNDLFKLYRYENQLFVLRMSGSEVLKYLEVSYDGWLNSSTPSYNYDSFGGLCYTVDVDKPFGERVEIQSLASGAAFDLESEYKVAMTSYRASGGGGLLEKTGIHDDRVIKKYPEIRDLMQNYIRDKQTVYADSLDNRGLIGHWEFVPEGRIQRGTESF